MMENTNITNLINENLDICQKLLQENNHPIIKKLTEFLKQRIEEIQKLCSVKKYDLFFNGQIGVGKSTAISTILNLISSKDVIDKNLHNSLLLKTGTGRTTICETQIIFTTKDSYIELKPIQEKELDLYLEEFKNCLNQNVSEIPNEYVKIIKNMLGIKAKNLDKITQEFPNLSSETLDSLKDKLNYKNRTKKRFDKNNQEFEEWLKVTFSSINDGLFEDTPIPEKIIIYISKKDMPIEIPDYINSITDTRGIDSGERRDIQEYLKRDNSISIMCNKVNNVGSNQIELSTLKQVLIEEDKDLKLRVAFLTLCENGELENITDCDTREEGMEEKRDQWINALNSHKVYINENNFFFYESALGFEISNKKIKSVNKDEIKNNSVSFFENINFILESMYSNYTKELETIRNSLEGLVSREFIEKDINEQLDRCVKKISEFKQKVKNEDFKSSFENEICKTILAPSLRGAVNHDGIGNTADIYSSFKKCALQNFENSCYEYKSNLVTCIKEIFFTKSDMENICSTIIVEKIDELYKKYYNEYGEFSYDCIHNKLYIPDFWKSPKTFWGDGLGNYRERVYECIEKGIQSKNIMKDIINKNYPENMFEEINNFLNI